jgi:hypothetical protein
MNEQELNVEQRLRQDMINLIAGSGSANYVIKAAEELSNYVLNGVNKSNVKDTPCTPAKKREYRKKK